MAFLIKGSSHQLLAILFTPPPQCPHAGVPHLVHAHANTLVACCDDAVLLIATLLAPKVKCTAWLGTAQSVFYDCFRSKEGVKLGLDSIIVLLTLDITVNYVNGSAMQPLTTCDKNSLELLVY